MFNTSGCLKTGRRARVLLISPCSILLCLGLAGCSFLKPAKDSTQYYLLTPVASTSGGAVAPAVGLGQIKMPAYLDNTSLVVRKGTNEVQYLDTAIWAERLDVGFQRVLAADLATLLPTDQVRLSAWQQDEVAKEVYVNVEQFDVDTAGKGILIARWRILSPGGDKVLKAERSVLTHQGPPPDSGASGAVATQSELVADLARQLARALK